MSRAGCRDHAEITVQDSPRSDTVAVDTENTGRRVRQRHIDRIRFCAIAADDDERRCGTCDLIWHDRINPVQSRVDAIEWRRLRVYQHLHSGKRGWKR